MMQAARQGISAELQAGPALDSASGGKIAEEGCQKDRDTSEVSVRQGRICQGVRC